MQHNKAKGSRESVTVKDRGEEEEKERGGGGERGGERQNGTAEGNALPSASRPPGAPLHHLP